MVRRLYRFFAARRRRSSSSLLQVVELAVPLDRSRDLEAGRAQQPDPLPDRPVDRDHDLRREQAVVAGPALRGVGDVVAEEVVRPDRHPGHPEGRAREVGVDDRQPVGDHRSAADRAQVRVLVLHLRRRSSTRSARPGRGRSRAAQVVDDVGAVAEEMP